MTRDLFLDMYYAAPELWYAAAFVLSILLLGLIVLQVRIWKLKQKNYFLNRDRERYAETLYASKDGYFAFIYPDEKVNDPRQNITEHCSRRLAVMMNLEKGTLASFDDILRCFYKEDARKILKYAEMLKEDGVSFEDDFAGKNNKLFHLTGTRINSADGNIYCDMIWFRDISLEESRLRSLEEKESQHQNKIQEMEYLINNLPYPVWLRDEKLNIRAINKKYAEYAEAKNKEEILEKNIEILNLNGESISKKLAESAHATNRPKKQAAPIIKNGQRKYAEVIETPFHTEGCLDKICTAGALIDITELDELKRNLRVHQNSHLEVLGSLGTAFAVFDKKFKLAFYNQPFCKMWLLDTDWLEQAPTYSMFLDLAREKRILPETPDYRHFKEEELQDFSNIIEAKEDMLHLPDGKTLRRVRGPHPMGGLVFAFEDVSDRLEMHRAYNELSIIRWEILENLFDAVLIFNESGKLAFFNQAYVKLWNAQIDFLKKGPSLAELIDSQKEFFPNIKNWAELKEYIVNRLLDITAKSYCLTRDDNEQIDVLSARLSDGSLMVAYKKL